MQEEKHTFVDTSPIDTTPASYAQIGAELNLSAMQVRRIELKALAKLKVLVQSDKRFQLPSEERHAGPTWLPSIYE